MNKLDEQSWKIYVKIRNLSIEEQNNRVLCMKLRETLDFALLRLNTACCNFGNEVFKAFGIKR